MLLIFTLNFPTGKDPSYLFPFSPPPLPPGCSAVQCGEWRSLLHWLTAQIWNCRLPYMAKSYILHQILLLSWELRLPCHALRFLVRHFFISNFFPFFISVWQKHFTAERTSFDLIFFFKFRTIKVVKDNIFCILFFYLTSMRVYWIIALHGFSCFPVPNWSTVELFLRWHLVGRYFNFPSIWKWKPIYYKPGYKIYEISRISNVGYDMSIMLIFS